MRTTIDLPDELYRSLKAGAALRGMSLKAFVRILIEQGLSPSAAKQIGRDDHPPILIPPDGTVIHAVTRNTVREIEEQEDEARYHF